VVEPVAVTRRSRVRDATVAEIKATARTLLVAEGPEALTLRAIARAMGMTAPALYRYFDSHEALVGACCMDLLDEITETLERARDAVGTDDPVGRLTAACRAFRDWSLTHRREFQLVFQRLSCPMLDDRSCTRADPHPLTGDYVWTPQMNRFGWRALLGCEPGSDEVPA